MASELHVPHSLAPAPFPGCVVCGHRGVGTFAQHAEGWHCRWCLERIEVLRVQALPDDHWATDDPGHPWAANYVGPERD